MPFGMPVDMPVWADGPLPGFAWMRMPDGTLPLDTRRLRHLAAFGARRKALASALHRSWFQWRRRSRHFWNTTARNLLWDIEPHQSASRLS